MSPPRKKSGPELVAIPLPLKGLEIVCAREILDEQHHYHVVLAELLEETIKAIALQSEIGSEPQNMESSVTFWLAERAAERDVERLQEFHRGVISAVFGSEPESFAVMRKHLFERCAKLEARRLIEVARS